MKKYIYKHALLLLIAFTCMMHAARAQYVTIPDTSFVNWLNNYYPSCMNGNQMDTTCSAILNTTILSITTTPVYAIADLTGLKYFKNLETFETNNNSASGNPLSNLPVLPQNLKEFLCLGCSNLAMLPNFPDSLELLSCSNCIVSSIPNLPTTLKYFSVNENPNLTQLPVLPAGLNELLCSNNNITNLAPLPLSLTKLICGGNPISTLPNLPNGLLTLHCAATNISALPTLPPTLKMLVCSGNNLTQLPTLPNGLLTLICDNNNLTSLPAIPNSVVNLFCGYNQINSLQSLPNTLYQLNFEHNNISTIPPLPDGVQFLIANDNNLTCLPQLPLTLTDTARFNINNNFITCVPNYVSGMDTSVLTLPLCQSNDSVNNPNGCDYAIGIVGMIYKDNLNNCLLEANDLGIKNILVKLFNPISNQFGFTNSSLNGAYSYPQGAGTYVITVDTLNQPFTANCQYPGIDTIVVTTALNPLASNVNFDIKCKTGLDLKVQSIIHKDGLIFPGQTHTLQAMVGDASQWYGLNCGSGTSGQVQITVTGPVTYNGTVPGALTPSINGNVFTYSIVDFGTINNANDFQLLFNVDNTAQTGNQICVHVEVTPISGDINPTNNIKDFCYYVVNSYDPNYKEVYPGDVAPLFQDWLTYTIHFQNLGTAPAINISLLDTLDSNLDAATFEVINYSHYNTVTMMDGILEFRFPNILLPDSATNPSGSQGFVQYRIKPKANLSAGTQIENTAHIYFDYNPAVVTNTTVNNFTTTVGNTSISENKKLFVYPNPSTGIFTISSSANIEVYNVVGELILSENNATSIDLTAAPKGMYFVKLNGGKIEKLIKN